MDFTIRRDFAALSFIRVTAPLDESGLLLAGGAGFSIAGALARCRSELAERLVERELRSHGVTPAGIAAHPRSALKALQGAYFEALESEIVHGLVRTGEFQGRILWRGRKTVWAFARLSAATGYFSLLVHRRDDGARIVAYSARRSLPSTLLKTWEEFRNPYFYKVSPEALSTYSKTGPLQGHSPKELRIENSSAPISVPSLDAFQVQNLWRERHHIVSLTRKENL